ncbi:MAG: LCP family protein [Lachnospirales bacterium]
MKNDFKSFTKKDGIMFVGIIVLVVAILSIFIFGGFYMVSSFATRTPSTPSNPFGDVTEVIEVEVPEEEVIEEGVTSILIFGTDVLADLADVIMVATFNHETKAIEVMNIPRDTFTYFNEKEKAQLKQAGWSGGVPTNTKMNSTYVYGKSIGKEFMRDHIEEFLQVDIDYVLTLDTAAFRNIVDAIGEVEFDVPQRMIKSDPAQDLYIDLYPGVQMLDGDKAEQLVRFRDYPEGDLTRVSVQQDFLKAVMKKLLTAEGLMNDPIALFKVFLEYVDTDFGLADATKYVKYIDDISMDNVNFETMPYTHYDSDYVYPDFDSLEEKTQEMFYPNSSETVEKKPDKEASIQILNGSRVNGLATEVSDLLANEGYNIKNIGNNSSDVTNKTTIRVRTGFDTTELESYFDDPIISVDNKMADYLDIIIVLGLDEDGEVIKSKLN